jgi:hypothetical protein
MESRAAIFRKGETYDCNSPAFGVEVQPSNATSLNSIAVPLELLEPALAEISVNQDLGYRQGVFCGGH